MWVANCDEYNNDGINPCLNDSTVSITMESGQPELIIYDEELDNYWKAQVTMEAGIITVKSSFKIVYNDIVKYTVTANVKTETGTSSISDTVELEKL